MDLVYVTILDLAIEGFAALKALPLDGILQHLFDDLEEACWISCDVSLCKATASTDQQFLKVWALLNNSIGVGGWGRSRLSFVARVIDIHFLLPFLPKIHDDRGSFIAFFPVEIDPTFLAHLLARNESDGLPFHGAEFYKL
jgi:hypothetical protein